jgi:IS5 family transposase
MGFGGTHRPGLDEALADRLSFRRFVGLALADPVRDDSILSRFRSELTRRAWPSHWWRAQPNSLTPGG